MKRLGAILAGGQSRRFGSDKAAALLDGVPLIDHVAAGLRPQVEAIVVCGRDWPGFEAVADRPGPDMGPLGGLAAALHYGAEHGFSAVVSAGCDALPVPDMMPLGYGPAVYAKQWLFGVWPVVLAATLDDHLARSADLSMRGWIEASGALSVTGMVDIANLNTPEALACFARNGSHE